MSRKYQKFGFRRDKNLSDAISGRDALSNILNDLPTEEGTTFIPEDIYVINGLSKTNVTKEDLLSLSGITPLVIDPENTNVQAQPIRPYLTLKDRLENYSIITGDPPFGVGGDGIKAIAIPQSAISDNIDENTTGDTIFDSSNEQIIEPYYFWDNGVFQFDNRLNENLPEVGGMIQWEGYFAPELLRNENTLSFRTTGFILIEENPTDTSDGWIKKHFLYTPRKEITAEGDGTPKTRFFVGDDIIYTAINQTIEEYPNNPIIDIDKRDQTIILENSITLSSGENTLTLNTDIGNVESEFSVIIKSLRLNEKIKVRFTLWWPNESVQLLKTFSADYVGSEGSSEFYFNYFYSKKQEDSNNQSNTRSLEYFNKNVYSPINEKTNNDFIVNDKLTVTYEPPFLLTDKIIHPNKATATYTGNHIIETTSNNFQNAEKGDWIINRNNRDLQFKVYQITEKFSSNRVSISKEETEPSSTIPSDFEFTIAKNNGLIGIYPYDSGSITTNDLRFRTFRIKKDNLVCNLSSEGNTDFFRVDNIENNFLTLDDFQNTTDSFNKGIICVYHDKGIDDRSKQVFCEGVFPKITASSVSSGSNTIELTDTSDLQTGLYVQYENYIPSGTTITDIDTSNNTITISNNTISSIVPDSTITISPDDVNREICNIPLNTAPPFEGTATGLKTTDSKQGVWVNTLELNNMEIKTNDINSLIEEVGTGTLTYDKSIDITFGDNTYKLIGTSN